MISRVAESCFWLLRYVERMDSTARLLRVHSELLLDLALPPSRTWRPLLIVLGEHPRFVELFGDEAGEDGEAVQEYLTWKQTNPVSIVSSLRMARDGARTIRETISLEMWQALNSSWIWLREPSARATYDNERPTFYEEVTRRCHLLHGACHNTMLHEEPFDFMRLGLNLERADRTARILDLWHHQLGPPGSGPESAVEAAEWIGILRACSAYEPFFKRRTVRLSGPAVAGFLLLDPSFPGSVRHALNRAWNFLGRIRPEDAPEIGLESSERLRALMNEVEAMEVEQILRKGIHTVLTRIIEGTAEVTLAVTEDFFSAVPPPAREETSTAPSGSDA